MSDEKTGSINVEIRQRTAKALFTAMSTDKGRNGVGTSVALRVHGGASRWESTNGSVLLLVEGPPVEADDGVYCLSRDALSRCAKMPARIWSDALDGSVVVSRDTVGEWPEVDMAVKSAGVATANVGEHGVSREASWYAVV